MNDYDPEEDGSPATWLGAHARVPGRPIIGAQFADTGAESEEAIFGALLRFLGHEMANCPNLTVPLTRADERRVAELVEGINVAADEPFANDFELP